MGKNATAFEKTFLRGLTLAEMENLIADNGFARYRGRQLFHWVQRKMADSFDEVKNIPKPLLHWLKENTSLGGMAGVADMKRSADGSYKFLFLLDDGKKIESVVMHDPKRNYWTQCLSSQVGCAVDCKFCVTGKNGFFRNLRIDEITGQVLHARKHLLNEVPDAIFRNVVYMGMGEPLLNTHSVIKSIQILSDQEGVDLSPRRMTVSTSGIIPGMIEFAEAETGACIAVSLNATTQAEREEIMPITRKYPLKELLEVCRTRSYGKHKRVTFEYVVMAGWNDSEAHARRLIKLLRGIPCKVNLIPFNPSPLLPWERPTKESIDGFGEILSAANLSVSVRWSKALDVDGACGQLAGKHQQQEVL